MTDEIERAWEKYRDEQWEKNGLCPADLSPATWKAGWLAALSSRGDAPMTQTKSEILLLMDELGVRSAGIERMGEFGEPADFPEIHSHGQAVLRGLSKVRDYILANASPASRGDAGTQMDFRKWSEKVWDSVHIGDNVIEFYAHAAQELLLAESALAHREKP